MERDKFPSLKMKVYLLSSADTKQWQDQQQLPVEEKKYGSLPGPSTYTSVITTKINPYGRKIKPVRFYKRPDQTNQFFKRRCDGECEETTLSQTRSYLLRGSRCHWDLSANMITPKKERVEKVCKGEPAMRSVSAPNNIKDVSIKCAREHSKKTEWILQRKTKSRWS